MFGYSRNLSEKIAARHSDIIFENQCYENVYQMVIRNIDELQPTSKLSVLFCYRPSDDNRWYRHAFCVFEDMLVEPLLYLDMSRENRSQLAVIKHMDVHEYLSFVDKEGGKSDLRDTLYPLDLRTVKEHGLIYKLGLMDLSQLYR